MLSLQLNETALPCLEAETLRPEAFVKGTADDVRRHLLWLGNRQVELGEFFSIEGDPTDGAWRFEGDLSGLHRLGEGMTSGSIHVEGNVGNALGKQMTGGQINVTCNAGDRPGEEMRGGRITINGNAGAEVGTAMRRGLIAVRGDAGERVGYRMRAGTILLLGAAGPNVGQEMIRGTIGLFGDTKPTLSPTFRYACDFEPAWLPMLATNTGCELPRRVSLFGGDLLAGGRGEVLLPAG